MFCREAPLDCASFYARTFIQANEPDFTHRIVSNGEPTPGARRKVGGEAGKPVRQPFQADTGAPQDDERRAAPNRDERVLRDIIVDLRFCLAGKRWKA
jgi:hypothetical protein